MPASILIVDDQESLRHFLGKALAEEGYAVHGCGTIAEAWERISQDGVDLILLDLRLPDGSGLEMLEAVREREPDLPVILMTAFGEIQTAVAAMKAGAFDFLTKPVNLEQVRVLCQKALESACIYQELSHRRK